MLKSINSINFQFSGAATAISGVLFMSLPIPIIVGHFGDEMAELVKKEKAMQRREKREEGILREQEIAKNDELLIAEAKSRLQSSRPVTVQPKSAQSKSAIMNHHIFENID